MRQFILRFIQLMSSFYNGFFKYKVRHGPTSSIEPVELQNHVLIYEYTFVLQAFVESKN